MQPLSSQSPCTLGCSGITPPCRAGTWCQWVPQKQYGLGHRVHAEPAIFRSPSKKKMQCISNISITVMYLMYFLAALFGYLTFYGEPLGRGTGALLARWCWGGGGAGADPAAGHTLVPTGRVESELLHTYNKVDPFDVLILCVRVAVLTAVTLTVPIVLFPVSGPAGMPGGTATPGCHRALAPDFERGK